MRRLLLPALACALAISACSNAPDLAAVEDRLAAVDGVLDADARWLEGNWKLGDRATLAVAVGDDLSETDVDALAPRFTDAVTDLDLDVTTTVAVELDDDADAEPFQSYPGAEFPSRPTDISTYTIDRNELEDRVVDEGLRLVVRARDAVGAPVQARAFGTDLLEVTADLDTTAARTPPLVDQLTDDPSRVARGAQWRISGLDFAIATETGLTARDAETWERLVSSTDAVAGLERSRVELSIDRDSPDIVARLVLATDLPALPSARRATTGLSGVADQLAQLTDLTWFDVEVVGPDDAVAGSFGSSSPRFSGWDPVRTSD